MDNLANFNKVDHMNNTNNKPFEEGFEGQQFILLSEADLLRCSAHPIVSQLYPLTFGYYPSAPSHRVHREEGKRGWSLHYCLHGKGKLKLAGKTFSINEGMAFILPPFEKHTYETDRKHPWSTVWVRFEGYTAKQYIDLLGATLAKPTLHIPDVKNLLHSYQQLYAERRMYYSVLDLIGISHFLGLFLTQAARKLKPLSARQLSSDEQIQKSIRFMEKNIHRDCRLDDFVASSGMSARNYSRRFRTLTGISPMNYFIQMKLNEAGHKLQSTALTIEQIAESLGYTDPLYFSRIFRKTQGISPSTYRREQIEGVWRKSKGSNAKYKDPQSEGEKCTL